MTASSSFDIGSFLPYLLNRAAEESSVEFARIYKDRFGLLRTEWRVLFHLGQHGELTATEIGQISKIHKTKVSRAVAALQKRRYLVRATSAQDRRVEFLKLTPQGARVFTELADVAKTYNAKLLAQFTAEEQTVLLKSLRILMQ
ncbi:MAG: MarR family transcriptional regulator [Rhodobacteraceae bacterium]|nr:MarR family transcriptional regulator [Paracoccaceae bacterium]